MIWKLLGLLVVSLLLLVCVPGVPLMGHRGDFMVGCTLAAAAVTSCVVEPDRWIVPHLAVRYHFECCSACSAYSSLVSFLVACC